MSNGIKYDGINNKLVFSVSDTERAFLSGSGLYVTGTLYVNNQNVETLINDKTEILNSSGSGAFIAGDVVTYNSLGQLQKTDITLTGSAREVLGIAFENDSTNSTKVTSLAGSIVEVQFSASPSVGDEGKPVYVSTTAGKATLTPPSSIGQRVFKLGILLSSTAGMNGYSIMLQPQLIADLQ